MADMFSSMLTHLFISAATIYSLAAGTMNQQSLPFPLQAMEGITGSHPEPVIKLSNKLNLITSSGLGK
jgi:hypothetical protein